MECAQVLTFGEDIDPLLEAFTIPITLTRDSYPQVYQPQVSLTALQQQQQQQALYAQAYPQLGMPMGQLGYMPTTMACTFALTSYSLLALLRYIGDWSVERADCYSSLLTQNSL